MHLCTRFNEFVPFCSDVSFVMFVYSSFHPDSHRFVGINNTRIFGLAFPNTAAGFNRGYLLVFCKAFFMVNLNSSSSGSMKKIPRSCLALSSFGFSIANIWAIHHQVLRLFVFS